MATKPARRIKVLWTACPLETLVGSVRITTADRVDLYHLTHDMHSCEVNWTHDDSPARSYTVTCSAADGKPTHCTCPANHNRVLCRHKAATKVLDAHGYLSLPRIGDAMRDYPTDAHDLGSAVAVVTERF